MIRHFTFTKCAQKPLFDRLRDFGIEDVQGVIGRGAFGETNKRAWFDVSLSDVATVKWNRIEWHVS